MINPIPTITLHPDESVYKKMFDYYKKFQEPNNGDYIALFANVDGCTVTMYEKNKKGKYSVVFRGPYAGPESNKWGVPDSESNANTMKNIANRIMGANSERVKEMNKSHFPSQSNINSQSVGNMYPQIGSDEVGTGDFCGPVIVVGAYVPFEKLSLINELGITDSKKMTDEYILSIGKQVISQFDYSCLVLMPEKYNEVHDENNMNAIKAKLHNQALVNLSRRHPDSTAYVDQFCPPAAYYKYVKDEPNVVRGINFSTKGESKYPSVAVASVIARYCFLLKMKELSEKAGVSLPFGAGSEVDRFIVNYMKNHSEEELSKIAKLHWANYRKYLENKNK